MLRTLKALRDVDSLKNSAESLEERTKRLEESNKRDPLTNLFNRAYLDSYLRDAFQSSNKTDSPLSIAFADLDKFKSVNDTYGHAMGDQILVTTANILDPQPRPPDHERRRAVEGRRQGALHGQAPRPQPQCAVRSRGEQPARLHVTPLLRQHVRHVAGADDVPAVAARRLE